MAKETSTRPMDCANDAACLISQALAGLNLAIVAQVEDETVTVEALYGVRSLLDAAFNRIADARKPGLPAGPDDPDGTSSPSLRARLATELDAVHLAMEHFDSFATVCSLALCGDVDNEIARDVAAVLDSAVDKVKEARDSLMNAIDLLPEVANG